MVLAYKSKDSKKEKEEKMRRAILQALEDRYNAQISEADATIKIYLDHSVGIWGSRANVCENVTGMYVQRHHILPHGKSCKAMFFDRVFLVYSARQFHLYVFF